VSGGVGAQDSRPPPPPPPRPRLHPQPALPPTHKHVGAERGKPRGGDPRATKERRQAGGVCVCVCQWDVPKRRAHAQKGRRAAPARLVPSLWATAESPKCREVGRGRGGGVPRPVSPAPPKKKTEESGPRPPPAHSPPAATPPRPLLVSSPPFQQPARLLSSLFLAPSPFLFSRRALALSLPKLHTHRPHPLPPPLSLSSTQTRPPPPPPAAAWLWLPPPSCTAAA
jgi:hypothetical protein